VPRFAQTTFSDIDAPPHNYRQRTPTDKFTQLKDALESGKLQLDRTSEKAFVLSLLRTLDVPATSQMLVFSTTSLQLSLISPANPRALYFNENTYVGYVPGGRVEILSLDPELGGIYYIFDIPRDTGPVRVERSERCMNCHAGDDTAHVPGLVIKSVIPGQRGGSLTAYRLGQTGHAVPFDQRFGGWYVTGDHGITNHFGNVTGRLAEGKPDEDSQPARRAIRLGQVSGRDQRHSAPTLAGTSGRFCEPRRRSRVSGAHGALRRSRETRGRTIGGTGRAGKDYHPLSAVRR